jgi:hypothetical protein
MFAPRNPVSTSLERNIVLGRILCCVSFFFWKSTRRGFGSGWQFAAIFLCNVQHSAYRIALFCLV